MAVTTGIAGQRVPTPFRETLDEKPGDTGSKFRVSHPTHHDVSVVLKARDCRSAGHSRGWFGASDAVMSGIPRISAMCQGPGRGASADMTGHDWVCGRARANDDGRRTVPYGTLFLRVSRSVLYGSQRADENTYGTDLVEDDKDHQRHALRSDFVCISKSNRRECHS